MRLTGFDGESHDAPARDSIYDVGTRLAFDDGTRLRCQFWRLRDAGTRATFSIFDHRNEYGMPTPFDAFARARELLVGRALVDACVTPTTGDILLTLELGVTLEIFNFTAFEIWEIAFPDGTGERSNYVLS